MSGQDGDQDEYAPVDKDTRCRAPVNWDLLDATGFLNRIFTAIGFEFREGGEARGARTTAGQLKDSGGPYVIKEESREKFEQLVNESFVKELGRSKIFELVDEVGPDTLLVRASLLDIVSNVPPNYTGTADVYLSAVGEATFFFELIDAETGEVQATVGERQRIQPPSRMYDVSSAPANSATIMNDIKIWATTVARGLRVALEKAQKKASQ